MDAFFLLTVAAIALGALGLALFFWALQSGQYDDMDGAAQRILMDDDTHSGRDGDTGAIGVPGGVTDQREDDDKP